VGLSESVSLVGSHDLDNYLFPLAKRLSERSGRSFVSVWGSKQHIGTSSICVDQATPMASHPAGSSLPGRLRPLNRSPTSNKSMISSPERTSAWSQRRSRPDAPSCVPSRPCRCRVWLRPPSSPTTRSDSPDEPRRPYVSHICGAQGDRGTDMPRLDPLRKSSLHPSRGGSVRSESAELTSDGRVASSTSVLPVSHSGVGNAVGRHGVYG
jgi:hypothetical protein